MKTLILNCTLKPSPQASNTAMLAEVVAAALREADVEVTEVRLADKSIPPGVETEMGEGDEWLAIHDRILASEIAGVVVTGNEDGAHHVIAEVAGALGDIGFTVPGQSWTYWNKGPGPGRDYSETEEGHDWSHATGRAAAANLVAVARALAANPVPPPPSG